MKTLVRNLRWLPGLLLLPLAPLLLAAFLGKFFYFVAFKPHKMEELFDE